MLDPWDLAESFYDRMWGTLIYLDFEISTFSSVDRDIVFFAPVFCTVPGFLDKLVPISYGNDVISKGPCIYPIQSIRLWKI
jgi:hypothetical protein